MYHDFSIEAIHKGHTVQRCSRALCFVVWWPHRAKPTSDCKGRVKSGQVR